MKVEEDMKSFIFSAWWHTQHTTIIGLEAKEDFSKQRLASYIENSRCL